MHTTLRKLIAALYATLALTGCATTHSTLPEERSPLLALPAHAERPEDPDLVVERHAVVEGEPEELYAALADVASWPAWMPNMTRTVAHAGRPLHAGDGFYQEPVGYRVEAKVLDAVPGRLLRWRGEADGIVGVHSVQFFGLGEGKSLVINREEFHSGWLRLVGWATDAGIGDAFSATNEALELRVAALRSERTEASLQPEAPAESARR